MVKQFSHQVRETSSNQHHYLQPRNGHYWANGVILGYKRRRTYTSYYDFFREVQKWLVTTEMRFREELGKWRFWTKELLFRTMTLKEQPSLRPRSPQGTWAYLRRELETRHSPWPRSP
jgi:hypothetical protein